MAIVPKGTPVRYTDSAGVVWGGMAVGDNDVGTDIVYYNTDTSSWEVAPHVETEDATGLTPNSYALVA